MKHETKKKPEDAKKVNVSSREARHMEFKHVAGPVTRAEAIPIVKRQWRRGLFTQLKKHFEGAT